VVRRAGAEAGVGFVNCLPVFIAREDWDKRFQDAGLPIIGDDIKSGPAQTSTASSPASSRPWRADGATSQLNVGGNMDFFNMLERERLDSKKISKTNAVTSIMGHELPERTSTSASDYVRGSPTASGRTSGSRQSLGGRSPELKLESGTHQLGRSSSTLSGS
jgi:myo-inositol-1-phosphate synthase